MHNADLGIFDGPYKAPRLEPIEEEPSVDFIGNIPENRLNVSVADQ